MSGVIQQLLTNIPPAAGGVANRELLHFNGTNGSTTITNSGTSGATYTVQNSGVIDTSQQKFGTASLKCAATTDGIESTNAVFVTLTDWVIDFWVRFTTFNGSPLVRLQSNLNPVITIQGPTNATAQAAALFRDAGGTQFGAILGAKVAWNLNQWYHMEVTRDNAGGKYWMYIDGVADGSLTSGTNVRQDTNDIIIGGKTAVNTSPCFMDEFRLAYACPHPGGTTFTPSAVEYT